MIDTIKNSEVNRESVKANGPGVRTKSFQKKKKKLKISLKIFIISNDYGNANQNTFNTTYTNQDDKYQQIVQEQIQGGK